MVFLGIDWADAERPVLRLAPATGGASILVPWDAPLRHRSTASMAKRCCGYFDVSTTPPTHIACERRRRASQGTQCAECRSAEGFTTAHQAHLGGALPPHVRAYLDQPHWLYLAIFADGSCKIGTAAASRKRTRLAEQGAYAALFVARATDGIAVRQAEAAVAERFQLAQAVPTSRKLRAVQTQVDGDALTARVGDLAETTAPYLSQYATSAAAVTSLDNLEPWLRPPCATALFDRTPVERYPFDLTVGEHTLTPVAVSGSVMALTSGGPALHRNDRLYAVDLSTLRGRIIEIAIAFCDAQ
jgi:hypothetical protein